MKRTLLIVISLVSCLWSCTKTDSGNGNQNSSVYITSIAPDIGGFDTEVIINGSNFSTVISENKVSINNATCNVVQAYTDQLRINIPKGCGSGTINITVNGLTATGPIFTYLLTSVTSTLAGNSLGYLDGQGTNALLNNPQYLNKVSDGSIIFSDYGNGYVRQIQDNGMVTTLQTKKYTNITGLAQADNKLFVADQIDNMDGMYADGILVWSNDFYYCPISNFATGNGGYLYGTGMYADAFGVRSPGLTRFNYTTYETTMYLKYTGTFDGSIAVAGATNILDIQLDNYNDVMYFLDAPTPGYASSRLYIRKIANYSKLSAVVTTLYNLSGNYYTTITTGDLTTNPDITFVNVGCLFVENENKIYLGSPGVIRKIEGNIVSIVAGDYYAGTNSELFGYKDGKSTSSRFNGMFDILEDVNKNLIVSDGSNNRIRKISFE